MNDMEDITQKRFYCCLSQYPWVKGRAQHEAAFTVQPNLREASSLTGLLRVGL